jgi:hypothetical protein
MCNHFIECVRDGRTPLTDGQNGLDVLRVMVAMDRSMKHNQESLQLKPRGQKLTPISKSELLEKSRAVMIDQEA